MKYILWGIIVLLCFYSCKSSKTIRVSNTEITSNISNDSNKLSFYKGDTIAYINYVYHNQEKYIGKPLSFLLHDLDFRINTFGFHVAANSRYKVYSISLIANSYNNPGKLDKSGINQDIELGVGWKTYVPMDSINAIIASNGPPDYYNWSKKAEEYFGKQIVGNLWLNYYMKR